MTKKHFIALADALRTAGIDGTDRLVTNGDTIAAPDEFVTVDEDGAAGDGRMIHIVIGNVTL